MPFIRVPSRSSLLTNLPLVLRRAPSSTKLVVSEKMSPETASPSENASTLWERRRLRTVIRGRELIGCRKLSRGRKILCVRGNACRSKNALSSRIASGRPPHAGCPRGNLGLFRQTCLALLVHYATALGIPLANGAYIIDRISSGVMDQISVCTRPKG